MNTFNHDMLILARESRGLSQTDASKAIGITQGTLSKIESGLIMPSTAQLSLFSSVLSYPAGFFQNRERQYSYGSGTQDFHFMYRKQAKHSIKHMKKTEARLNVCRLRVERLLRQVQLEPALSIPFFTISEVEGDMGLAASMVRMAWNMPSGPVQDLVTWLEDAGCILIPFDFESDKICATTIFNRNSMPPFIFYNKSMSADRMRFTMAHELGHIVLHTNPNPDMEEQANNFASNFLSPSRDIYNDLQDFSLEKAVLLKRKWKISIASLTYRAKQLETISDSKYQKLFMDISKRGWRMEEPSYTTFPKEKPLLLNELLDLYSKDLGYSPKEISEFLWASSHDLDELRGAEPPQRTKLKVLA